MPTLAQFKEAATRAGVALSEHTRRLLTQIILHHGGASSEAGLTEFRKALTEQFPYVPELSLIPSPPRADQPDLLEDYIRDMAPKLLSDPSIPRPADDPVAKSPAPSPRDRQQDPSRTNEFVKLVDVYNYLTDPERKARYDRSGEGDNSDYYKLLGLPPRSDIEEVKKAFKKIAVQVHPDKQATPRVAPTETSTSSRSSGPDPKQKLPRPPPLPGLDRPIHYGMAQGDTSDCPSPGGGSENSHVSSGSGWFDKGGGYWVPSEKRSSPRVHQEVAEDLLKKAQRGRELGAS